MRVSIFGPTLEAKVFPFDGTAPIPLDSDGSYSGLHNDLLGIETNKTLDNPVGTFSLTLTSRRDSKGRTWAQRIRPMDFVMIFMGRTTPKGVQSTVVMRCFVDNAYESTVVQGNTVQRIVTINGRDYGKVLLKRAIVYYNELDPVGFLGFYNIGQKLGPAGLDLVNQFLSPHFFLERVRDYLLNDATVGAGFRSNRIPLLHSFTDIPDTHTVNFINVDANIGPIWTFLQQWIGQPWNEMFLRDDDDAPRMYWRQAPLKDKQGWIIPHGSRKPQEYFNTDAGTFSNFRTTDISLDEVIHPNVGTSDNEAYCAFFALPTFAETLGGDFAFIYPPGGLATLQGDNPIPDPFFQTKPVTRGQALGGNPIVRPDIFQRYGFNYLRQSYPLYPLPTPDEQKNESTIYTIAEAVDLASWLHNAYSPNPAFESGTLELRGRPELRIGNYVRIVEQDREFYIEGVRHSFSINPPIFTTTCDVTRGLWHANNPYPELDWL